MRVTSLESLLEYAFEKGYFNGTWLYKKDGVIVSRGALGSATPKGDTPLNIDSMFDVASISKQFTASAVMLLRNRGLLTLDDPLEQYFPGILYPGICVRNLLNHTSGLPAGSDWIETFIREHPVPPGNDVIENMLCASKLPKQFEPGTQWAYCNTGYTALALIVEKISGMAFPDFMQSEIFAPCGMERTGVIHRYRDRKVPENYAHGMVLEGGRYMLVENSEKEGYTVRSDGIEGDGAVKTTVGDLLLWDEALRKEIILPLQTQQEMFAPTRLSDGSVHSYGYGWEIGENETYGKQVTHYGRWAGYHSVYSRMLGRDSMVVMLCNQTGCDTMARCETLDAAVELVRTGSASLPQSLDEKADPSAAGRSFSSLQGAYHAQKAEIKGLFDDVIRVYGKDDKLMIRLLFMDSVFDTQLVPVGPNHFIAREGLFDITFAGDALRTEQFDRDFFFVREA